MKKHGWQMTYRPMNRKDYEKYIKKFGWKLEKGSIDYTLYNQLGVFLCSIKITHGANTKGNEVIADSVKKTERLATERGYKWPPQKKKSKKN